MSSETSTKPGQVFILLAMAAATVAVMLTGQTHPVALLLLSAGVLAVGLAAYFFHTALFSLISPKAREVVLTGERRALLVADKRRALHSIKELEFDHRMGKINALHFQELAAPLRLRAATLITDLDRLDKAEEGVVGASPAGFVEASRAGFVEASRAGFVGASPPGVAGDATFDCPTCGTLNDTDARFCKNCGHKLDGDSGARVRGAGANGAMVLFAVLGALTAGSASAQVAMPNPKEISGVPLPAADVPAGTLTVRVIRGGFDKNLPDLPVQFVVKGQTRTVKTNEQGRAELKDLPEGTTVTASVTVDREVLTSQTITIGTTGLRVVLVATDPDAVARATEDATLATGPAVRGTVVLGPNTRVVVQPGDEVLTVYYILDIVNSARTPVDIGGPLQLDLPEGARGAGVMAESSPQGKLIGAHLTVVGPFKPGSTEVQLAFELPTGTSTHRIEQTWPVAVPETTVVLEQRPGQDIVSPQLTDKRETVNDGQPLVFARAAALGPGGTLAFDVTGLPHHPRWPRYLALTLAVGFLLAGLREGFRRA